MNGTRPPLPPDDEPPPPFPKIPRMPDIPVGTWCPLDPELVARLEMWTAWNEARSELDGIGLPVYERKSEA